MVDRATALQVVCAGSSGFHDRQSLSGVLLIGKPGVAEIRGGPVCTAVPQPWWCMLHLYSACSCCQKENHGVSAWSKPESKLTELGGLNKRYAPALLQLLRCLCCR